MTAGGDWGGGAARYAGTRVARVEDPRLLTGTGGFVDDVQLPGMLHVCFVRSPYAAARITSIDTTAASTLDGVRAVFVATDLNPGVHEQWHTSVGPDVRETPRPPLAEDTVRFAGDPVALVVASSRYVAEDACDLVVVDYEPLPAVVDYLVARDSEVLVHDEFPGNVFGTVPGGPTGRPGLGRGEPDGLDQLFAAAPHVVSETFFQHAHAAVPMETRGLVVDWSRAGGEVTIWAATQAPHEIRMFAARLLGLPEHRVRVIMRDTGGGFGQKGFVQREEMAVMLAAGKVHGPVKWIEDRRENLVAAGFSRHEHGVARMAFDDDARILAAQIDHVSDCGAYPTPAPVRASAMAAVLFPGPYRVPRGTYASTTVFSNRAGRSPYRGPWQFESVAREVLLDIAARELAIDPIELRRRNLLALTDMPYTNCNGMVYDLVTPLECFEQALAILGYDDFRREQADARERGRYLGVGTCTFIEQTTPSFGYYATEGATIRIEPSGKVNVYVAGGSAGNSIETTVVQLAADALGVDIEDVNTIQGDTSVTPFGAGTAGSRSGSMLAGVITEAAGELREKLVGLAAHRLEAATEDVELAHGRANVRGTPSAGISYADLARLAYFAPAELPAGMTAGLEVSARYANRLPFNWANATHVCTCEVDVTTGVVKLLRYIVAEDCGPMINPNLVEGQIAGGTVQGIGGALYEHLVYDNDGNPLATTFMDYLLPTATEVPLIEHGHLETPSVGPGGYKGVGEGGAIGAPPAVINAVADALAPFGARITRQPLTPAAIVALLAGISAETTQAD